MISSPDILALYREFTDALTEVLAENSVGPARRGRLARARAAVKKHPNYSEHEYFLGGNRIQTVGSHSKRRSLGPIPYPKHTTRRSSCHPKKRLHVLTRRSVLPCHIGMREGGWLAGILVPCVF
jgi:hypothetical protein